MLGRFKKSVCAVFFARLESGAEGKNDQQRTIVENFRVELQRVIAARNVAAARELHDRMDQAFVSQNLVVFAFLALKEAHNHLADWPGVIEIKQNH